MAIPPIGANDIVQTVIETNVLGQTCLNVLYYKAHRSLSEITYQEAMDLLNQSVRASTTSGIVPEMVKVMGANATVTRVRSQRVSPRRDIYVTLASPIDGELPNLVAASNVSAVISKQGEIVGRGRTGSFHVPGLSPSTYGLGYMTDPAMASLSDLADKLNDPQVVDGGDFIFHPGMWNPALGPADNWNPSIATTPQRTLRVMRRRTVGVGI